METQTIIKYTLDQKEIQEAIRKHLVDKLGTGVKFQDKDIVLNQFEEVGVTATICVIINEKK